MFIFVLQGVWLYISELTGKDLDAGLVLRFLWLYSPKLIPLVLPLTILVTSLMVFGSFAEKYEFAAMKSTGISLQRAMRSLTFFILGLSLIAFFFANNIIPDAEYKWQNLRRNIKQFSPSMVIAEGQFSQVGDINIKVEEKTGENKEFLHDVIIHKKDPAKPNGNYTVIIAETGEFASEKGSNTLSLILRDGNYYEEIQPKKTKQKQKLPFIKSEFEEYTINIDLTEINEKDTDKDNNYSNQNMFKASELVTEIDSLSTRFSRDMVNFSNNIYYRSGLSKFGAAKAKTLNDTIKDFKTILDVFNEQNQSSIISQALTNARGTVQAIKGKDDAFKRRITSINKHQIALHEKFVLAVACIILFFIGAPLGAIIRKGGMGLPMVVAVVLFLSYHFIGIFAKNSAEDGTLNPVLATWISTLIMLPLSIWLTIRATTDQGIFDIDGFVRPVARLFKKKKEE